MKLWKKLTIAFGIPILVIPAVAITLFVYSGNKLCGNEIFDEAISPDKKLKAVLFQRDCGMTTGFSTQISIIKSEESLKNSKGNIFVIDGHPNTVAPSFHWESNNSLRIFRDLEGSENKAVKKFGILNKVNISYVADNG